MKLLLTSGGLTNASICRALTDMVGKPAAETKIAFIPTAANVERGDKAWLINDLYRLHEQGYFLDIIELTALSPQTIISALEDKDVIFVGGGNTFYLSYWLQKSGLFDALPRLLATKVYAGISAGSMIMGTSLVLSSQAQNNLKAFEDEDYGAAVSTGEGSGRTLSLAPLIFRPHLNSRWAPHARNEVIAQKAAKLAKKVYALDDNSALKIVDGRIEVVSEGSWKAYN
ncbi:MAG: Type 1 glutamine amidotransferase-like domain-containing protein [Candidatus Micrarchaeaceae archaeon]